MNTVNRATFSLGLVTVTLVAFAAQAAASTGHGEPSLSDLTVYWGNFAVYVTLMYILLRKPISQGWAARRSRIQAIVEECSTEVEKAEREMNAIEALTKSLTTEQERARQEILSQAKAEADAIVTQAQEKATRMREQSKEMLAGEARSAESTFKASLVAKALGLAREKFTKGEFAGRQQAYLDAAVGRAKRLTQ